MKSDMPLLLEARIFNIRPSSPMFRINCRNIVNEGHIPVFLPVGDFGMVPDAKHLKLGRWWWTLRQNLPLFSHGIDS
jgi:hypothetical protein